jgi:hypothetical protein
MYITVNSQLLSYFIIQAVVYSQGSCSHLSIASCIFKHCIFIDILGINPSIVIDDKENYHQEDNKKGPLRLQSFHSQMLLKQMMMTVGSDGMIVSFLCVVLCR